MPIDDCGSGLSGRCHRQQFQRSQLPHPLAETSQLTAYFLTLQEERHVDQSCSSGGRPVCMVVLSGVRDTAFERTDGRASAPVITRVSQLVVATEHVLRSRPELSRV